MSDDVIACDLWFGPLQSKILATPMLAGYESYHKNNFQAGFKTLSFSQPVYSLFAADKGTNPEMAGRVLQSLLFSV